jgi:biofilm PGA synthesis protein PgaD
MRAEAPVISRPENQSKTQRFTSGTLTIIGWGIWIYLWLPVLTALAWIVGIRLTYAQLTHGPGLDTILFLIMIAILCSIVVAGWASYNYMRFGKRSRRMGAEAIGHATIAKTFGVTDPATLSRLLQERRMNLYFDNAGNLTRVEALGADTLPTVEALQVDTLTRREALRADTMEMTAEETAEASV